ncbi:MAG: leucine-rich repeat domain-containing protein [Proteobacteria bacterium]|nr:leucine-rich repeat domain-containing protein [Pseudomonadota bacterium]
MKTPFKKLMSIAAVIWLAAVSIVPAQDKKDAPPAAKTVPVFPDKNLEKAVRRQVFEKRDNDQPLTEKDVENIAIIDGKGLGIIDLSGLEKCRALASLDLARNQIKGLAPLQGLARLQYLNLAENQIEDVSPLKDIVALQYLELSGNRVKEIAPLAGLTNMASLYLSRNGISDLKPLAGMRRLASLYLDGNPVTSLQGVGNLAWLSSLSVNDAGLADVSGLEGVRNLNYFSLERNKVTDLSPFLPVVKRDAEGEQRFAPFLNLYVTGNPLSSTGKSSLAKLKAFGVRVKE